MHYSPELQHHGSSHDDFGAGDGTRTRDVLLGRLMPALSNLIQAPKGVVGPSWPLASKG
jgi:hypothetical protein